MPTQKNIDELAAIAQKIGAATITGDLHYTLEKGWHIGDAELEELLEAHRDRRVVLVIASTGETEDMHECGICGHVMSQAQPCSKCEEDVLDLARRIREQALFDEVRRLLGEDEG